MPMPRSGRQTDTVAFFVERYPMSNPKYSHRLGAEDPMFLRIGRFYHNTRVIRPDMRERGVGVAPRSGVIRAAFKSDP
jgi:hypothetical protein